MTTISREYVRCAVCGEESEQPFLTSTNVLGSSDLDTRPPEMARSNIAIEVQRCPSCGFCAPCLDEDEYNSAAFIRSEEYRARLTGSGRPDLANSYLCSALISEGAGEFGEAGWQAVRAAWACDDAGAAEASVACRDEACRLFVMARRKGQSFMGEDGGEEAVLVDLLRRSGRFEEAMDLCERSLESYAPGLVSDILSFEKKLIAAKDVGAHTIDEGV